MLITRFILYVLLFSLVGCSISNTSLYKERNDLKAELDSKMSESRMIYSIHKEYGKVKLPHEFYARDEKACRQKVYQKGVTINGELVVDTTVINDFRQQHLLLVSRLMLQSVLAGGTVDASVPKGFAEAKKINDDIEFCLKEMGWSKRIIEYVKVPDKKDTQPSSLYGQVFESFLVEILKH